MTRQLPTEDAGTDFIQYRGRGTSVTIDGAPVRFAVDKRNGRMVHAALPVCESDDQDPDPDAVVRPLAEHLVETNNQINFGVACEHPDCGEVFETPEKRNGHMQTHASDGDGDTADAGTTDGGNEQ